MPTLNQSPTINIFIGGPAVQVDIAAFTGPNSDIPDTTSVLTPQTSPAPGIATIAVHPTNPRAVVITPAATGLGGSVGLIVTESPPVGNNGHNLQLNVTATVPPDVRQLVYVGQGPVT